MRPSDVVAARRTLLEQCLTLHERDMRRSADQPPEVADPLMHAAGELCLILPTASLYLVTEDMTAVAINAGRSMPDQYLRPDDLPSERGFILYERPIAKYPLADEDGTATEVDVVGAGWALTLLDEDTEADPAQVVIAVPLVKNPRNNYGVPLPVPTAVWPTRLTDYPDGSPIAFDDDSSMFRVLRASWTLMQQTLVVSEFAYADRAERRRSARAGLPSDLVVIHLRKRRHEAPEAPEGEAGVDWSHRWLVSGHWRNQWLPSRTCHRLQWIDAHVKGPENRPLILKERVHVWSR